MNRNEQFRHQDWDNAPLNEGQGDDCGRDRQTPPEPGSIPLAGLLLQAGLWASGCLVIASTAPVVLVAPLLRELLVMTAFAVSMIGLLRGERLTLRAINRQDVALLLIALAMIAALFIDHAAVQAYVDTLNADSAAGAAAASG